MNTFFQGSLLSLRFKKLTEREKEKAHEFYKAYGFEKKFLRIF
jgi:hypothetical protein